MKTVLSYIIHYLQDGTPRKLTDIARAVKALGYEGAISSQYIVVYQTIRSHPELFKRTEQGVYQFVQNNTTPLSMDQDQMREEVADILRKRSGQTVTQVWRALMSRGVIVTYNATQYLLQADMFTKDEFSRYSNEDE